MGWFGCSRNEMDEDMWEERVIQELMGLPDDTLITVVDCHI
jgi:hypothetical protein